MNRPAESFIETSRGTFRALTWGAAADEGAALFLHGLTAVAEVWGPTVSHLHSGTRHVAIDQRGHGDSPHEGPYTVGSFVRDTRDIIRALGAPVHLVGHSMGARVAIAIAARSPELLRSVTIVDIGVEASRQNVEETREGIQRMPTSFANEGQAVAFAFRNRAPGDDERTVFRARLRHSSDGFIWRGSPEAMVSIVEAQRARSYWKDWRSISVPALFIHGSRSREVSPMIADRMRAANPSVQYLQFEGAPHNIPLAEPERLASELEAFWHRTGANG